MANNLYRCVGFTCSFPQKTIVCVDFFIRTTHWNVHFGTVLGAFTSLASFIANHAMRVRWSEALFVTGSGYWNLRHTTLRRILTCMYVTAPVMIPSTRWNKLLNHVWNAWSLGCKSRMPWLEQFEEVCRHAKSPAICIWEECQTTELMSSL